MIAVEPSMGTSQSKIRRGDVMMGDAMYSSSVSGLRYTAAGFNEALRRPLMAICATCSGLMPDS